MSWAATAISVVSTVVSAGVSIYTSNAAADAQETAAAYNAKQQREQAQREGEIAAENARRREKEAAAMVARQRAALAGQGLAMEGTPLAVLGDSYLQAQQDSLDISFKASERARALRQSAAFSLVDGKNTASATRIQGYGQAAGSIAGTTNSYLT